MSFVLLSSGGICCHNWMHLPSATDAPPVTRAVSLPYRSPAPIIYGIWLWRREVGEATKRTRGAAKINLSLAARAIITQNIIQLRASHFARSGVSLFTVRWLAGASELAHACIVDKLLICRLCQGVFSAGDGCATGLKQGNRKLFYRGEILFEKMPC